MQDDWIEHRRPGDRERLGWMQPAGDGFIAIDLLGRERTGVVDWLEAEELLDDIGLRYLADPYEILLEDGHWLRVRIADVSPDTVRVKKDDWGDMTATQVYYTVPFPADPALLREWGADDAVDVAAPVSETEPAAPGLAPPDTSAYIELGNFVVNGETFVVRRRADDGSTHYDWVSGPNEGYGFGISRGGEAPTREEHVAAIRDFLAGINPETGYL